MASTDDQAGVRPETGEWSYRFCTVLSPELGTGHYRQALVDPVRAFLAFLNEHLCRRGPRTLAIFKGPLEVEVHRWCERDSARLAVFVSRSAVERFEAHYPGYRRPRVALDAASLALDRTESTATDAANRAGRELARIAARAARQGVPKDHVRCVWAAADAARSVAWEYHGSRTQSYLHEAVKIAAEVDQHLTERVKLWLAFYLRTRTVLGQFDRVC